MSEHNGDEESTEDLWDEIEEFAEDDPSDVDEFVESDSNDTEEFVDVEPVEAKGVTDPEPTEDSPADVSGERKQTAVDDPVPDTEDAPDVDEVFDEMDVSAVDGEALWDELAGSEADSGLFDDGADESDRGEAAASVDPETSEVDEPVDTEPVEPSLGSTATADRSTGSINGDSTGDTETLVDKRAYCQQCPFFSEPPNVHCGHAGTEIVEVITDGRFRVRNCPVVTDTGPDRTILNDGH